MIFIGGGFLIFQAVEHSLKLGLNVDLVLCPENDSAIPKLKKLGVDFVTVKNPNFYLIPLLNNQEERLIFSINNKFILDDKLLQTKNLFFNIHNGLIQKYRGISEVCVLAALCNREYFYGVTLHRLLPQQEVDSGPVVSQLEFEINSTEDFITLMKCSLKVCNEVFEKNILNIVEKKYQSIYVPVSEKIYTYKDVEKILLNYKQEELKKLLAHSVFFPKLNSIITNYINQKDVK
jgi:methionyl-tRNA formyltransferase